MTLSPPHSDPAPQDGDLSLDDEVAILRRWRIDPPADLDPLELAGDLAASLLDLAARDADDDALAEALALFEETTRQAPEHPRRQLWWYGLGVCLGERAKANAEIADFDGAIYWLTRLREDLPAGDPDLAEVTGRLADLLWLRFWLVRWVVPIVPEQVNLEVDRLATAMTALEIDGDDPDAWYARMLRGLALLERFEVTQDSFDLDAGISALSTALPRLEPGTPWRGEAATELAFGYLARADRDGDSQSIDLVIVTGEQARLDRDTDDPDDGVLNLCMADAYQRRWYASDDLSDLDRAIDFTRAVVPDPDIGWPALPLADLLRDRAIRSRSLADADEAVRLLERAAQSPLDEKTKARVWYLLGSAHHVRWRVGEAPGSLTDAVRCLDTALLLSTEKDDELLEIHVERVAAAATIVDEGAERQPDFAAGFDHLSRCVAEACADLDGATAASDKVRAGLAWVLVYGEFSRFSHMLPDADDLVRIRRHVGLAATFDPDNADLQARLAVAEGTLDHAAIGTLSGAGDHGAGQWVGAAGRAGLETDVASVLRRQLSLALNSRGTQHGDLRGVQMAAANFWAAVQPESDTDADPEDLLPALLLRAVADAQAGRIESSVDGLRRATQMIALTSSSAAVAPMVHFLLYAMTGETDADFVGTVPGWTAPGLTKLLADYMRLSTEVVGAVRRRDLASLRVASERAATLVADVPADHPLRVLLRCMAGACELEVARLEVSSVPAARHAADHFVEALTLMRGPIHPLWPMTALRYGQSLRLARGDRDRSREFGRSALRGHAWRVLQQTGTDFALEAATTASEDALTVADWCVEDGAVEELISVLDAGRGLVLQAATASMTMADRLAQAGHVDLAREWRSTAGLGRDQLTGGPLGAVVAAAELPDDLRVRALQALTAADTDGAAAPVDPVDVTEVREALSMMGADALVYLVPATEERPGRAVVLPVDQGVDVLTLPDLTVDSGSPVSEHLAAGRSVRDLLHIEPGDARGSGDKLDELCRWAWSACVGPLLRHAEQWQLHRPVRLALVPMGPLGLVPWHAAYTGPDDARRYAVQHAVFSYGVSARMLCASARHQVRPVRSALLVGDPRGDLAFASIEARAIHRRFYPGGSYFGRLDGAHHTGTPDEVLDWVRTAGADPSLLHLACHGRTDPARPANAELLLADGELPARCLLEVMQTADLQVDQVFLAACTTHVTGADYDEALSIATAFLAAGAHTVFGSLWAVPDAETSLLMFMVHHYLNTESCAPADALHSAQLWMLDPARRPPAGMPPELVDCCDRPEAANPISWAAFTHLGR